MRVSSQVVLPLALLLVASSSAAAQDAWVGLDVEGEGSDSIDFVLSNEFGETLEVDLSVYAEGNVTGWRISKGFLGEVATGADGRPRLEPGEELGYRVRVVDGPENGSLDAFVRAKVSRPGAETTTGLQRFVVRSVTLGAPSGDGPGGPEGSTDGSGSVGMGRSLADTSPLETETPNATATPETNASGENESGSESGGGLPVPAPGPGALAAAALLLASVAGRS